MIWWKEIAHLKQQLTAIQGELEKEQGKTARLAGFMGRLQTFGISPTGRIPRREFAEAFIDSVHALMSADQVFLLRTDPQTLDLLPAAGCGFSPDALARMRVRPGEGALGRAAQNMKTVIENEELIVPLISQGRCVGLLSVGKPQEGTFTHAAREAAALLAAQAALLLEDHDLYEELEQLRDQAVAALARAIEAKDTITHKHSDRTRALVRAVGQDLALPDALIRQIEYGA